MLEEELKDDCLQDIENASFGARRVHRANSAIRYSSGPALAGLPGF